MALYDFHHGTEKYVHLFLRLTFKRKYMQSKALVAENKNLGVSLSILRISLGIVYLWFGALKYFQGISPAEQLAAEVVQRAGQPL